MTSPRLPAAIRPLSPDAGKAEEIAFLEAVAGLVAPGTYLASLFSPELVASVARDIRADVAPDLFAVEQHLRAQSRVDAERIAQLERQREQDNRAANAARERLIAEQAAAARDSISCIDKARADVAYYRELRDQAASERDEARDQVLALQQQVARLQAHIFALEHPELV